MSQLQLFEGEKMLFASKDGVLTVTDFRVRFRVGSQKKSTTTSILLQNVGSIQVKVSANGTWLILAFVLVVGGIMLVPLAREIAFAGISVLGLLAGFGYIASKKRIISISALNRTEIVYQVKGKLADKTEKLVEVIEKAAYEAQVSSPKKEAPAQDFSDYL
ncbi:hypothetical protein [Pontibacter sp. G13]|uniref:hypothetical protein n=1 Tax=Pontibacter sp. G13 TaxID=3074898 RepID=UPI002889C93B|nr:hypothetical protein [Pontibacter sp. G13]WNJ16210.1 hypothetical protein RJD25_15205 [Pontibacter sp. G13]